MKQVFPKEFSDILNRKGLDMLSGKNKTVAEDGDRRIKVVQDIIQPRYAESILTALEKNVFPLLRNCHAPVPASIIEEMTENYSEKLGKSMKMKSAEINSHSKTYKMAKDIGLVDMLASESYRGMGQSLMGEKFGRSIGKQIICYEHGNYVSPHNDHHPENENIKDGYFDIQLMLSNKYVQHQWLVYEQQGFLNKFADITSLSGMAVYRLPFWHYTTPMMAKKKSESMAKRWLLLHSYEFTR
ncbi:MAG: hypothetical protein QM687_10025 [Ferruginibacter sp.]